MSQDIAAARRPVAAAPDGRSGRRRGIAGRALASAAVALLLATCAAFAGDLHGLRERLVPLPRPAAPLAHGVSAPGDRPVLASNPYWQTLAALRGDAGQAARTVAIAPGALQWRVSWSCRQGARLRVGAAGREALIDAGCPGTGTAYGDRSGALALAVNAGGPWDLTVEQQIDAPVDDPPLPAMTAAGASAVAAGSFYAVDFDAHGSVTVYRLPGGGYALRLDHFYVTPNSSLDLRFSAPAAPHSDGDVSSSAVATVADLRATAGSMNVGVPPGLDPRRFGSVVVWCSALNTAYAAATLRWSGA